ncbi:MAG: adenylosuccinate lyase, partial [Dehalococcoidia bacterium]
ERTPFLDLLCEDEDVLRHLSREELASLFDYEFYTRHVDDSFRRVGLL